jgi:Fic family protein
MAQNNPFEAIHTDIASLRKELFEELQSLRLQLQLHKEEGKKEYLTRKDVAKQFSVSLPTVHAYMHQGLPYIKKGAKTLFKAQDVYDFFEAGRKK